MPQLLDRSIGRFRQGMKSGVFETKLTIRNVIDQLDAQLKQKPEESQLYAPVKKFPDVDQRRRPGAADGRDPRRDRRPDLPGDDPACATS